MVTRGWRDPPWTRRAGATWAPPTTGDGGGRPAARLASRRPLPPHGQGAKLSRACPSPLPAYTGLVARPCRRLPGDRELAAQSCGAVQGPQFLCIGGGPGGEARVFYRPTNCSSTSCGVSEVCTSVNYNKPTRVQSLVRTAPAERGCRPQLRLQPAAPHRQRPPHPSPAAGLGGAPHSSRGSPGAAAGRAEGPP